MKRILAVALAAAIGIQFAFSQEQQPKRALAEELLVLMKVNETIEQSFAMVKQMTASRLDMTAQAAGQTEASADVINKTGQVMEIIFKELSWDNIKEDYIALYADSFTEEELRGMIAFYKTPVGQAMAQKTPELTKKSMELSQKRMVRIMPKIQAMMQELKHAPQAPAPQPGTDQ
ncbi:MAG: DUF2059 domain-containing protein [Kiritimatiellae bacterium]|nr:DUF2059 domain-containing protein [Kiritimatiellia bacterium]